MHQPREADDRAPARGIRQHLALLLTLLLIAQCIGPLAVAARQSEPDGTPTAQPSGSRPVCNSPMASATGLAAILQAPAPEDPDVDDPQGDVLAPAERAPIDDLMAHWRDCLASGNVRGLLGLFTADGVRRLLTERSPYVGGPAGLRVTVLAIGDVIRLRDGRIAARVLVDPSGSGSAAPESLLVVAEQGEDGVWRIDHLRPPAGPVGAAGPAQSADAPERPLLRRPIAPGANVPAQPPGPDVPMRAADAARTGNQPGPLPGEQPSEVWRSPTGWHSPAQPAAGRGLVYFGGYSLGERMPLLAAVDMATGRIRWQTTAPVAWAEFSDTPALAGDVLYAPVEAPVAGVLAVLASTGQPVWFAPFGFTSVTAPASSAEMIYVAGWGVQNSRDRVQNDTIGTVFALDQRTGRERWRFLAPARFGPVAVGREAIFVPSDHGLFALDRATGRKRWQARFSPGPEETPTVAGDMVAFTGTDITTGTTGIFALDANSGALRWRVDLPAVFGARAGTAVAGTLLVVSWWDSPEGQPGSGAPTLRAYALDSGEEQWVFRPQAASDAPENIGVGTVTEPAVVGTDVLFGVAIRVPAPGITATLDGIYAVDAATGTLRWQASPATPIGSAPVALNGQIVAMGGLRPRGDAAAGSLLAFRAE